jgi:hypothetical protein
MSSIRTASDEDGTTGSDHTSPVQVLGAGAGDNDWLGAWLALGLAVDSLGLAYELALDGAAGLADAGAVDGTIDGDWTAADPHADRKMATVVTSEMRRRTNRAFTSAPWARRGLWAVASTSTVVTSHGWIT